MSAHSPGRTQDAGWQIGVRKTLPISVQRAWELLLTQPGLGVWLGHDPDFSAAKGYRYRTLEGTVGEIRSAEEGRLLRLTWRPAEEERDSTLQVRVLPAATGATISFHHERLADAAARERMRERWQLVLEQLAEGLPE